jgi:hypothetical protein
MCGDGGETAKQAFKQILKQTPDLDSHGIGWPKRALGLL